MQTELIILFREKVNRSMIFRNLLRQQEPDRRPWNVICSAMDWIETAATWLEHYEGKSFENDYLASMDFSFYVVAVDTLLKGMEQIEKVFSAREKDLEIHSERKSIRCQREGVFENLYGDKNNACFFKNIRAIFSAHTVEMNLPRGFFNGKDEEGQGYVRCCASWSIRECGFETVYLYPKSKEGSLARFSVNRKELQLFAEQIYGELTDYLAAIDVITEKCRDKYKQQIIDRSGSPTEFINRLMEENRRRLSCDYYEELLKKIHVILTSTCLEPIVGKLQIRAKNLLQEIADAIQNAEYREFDDDLREDCSLSYSASKAFAGLEEMVVEGDKGTDFFIFESSLLEEIKDIVIIPEDISYQDLYTFILAAIIR